MSSHSPGLKTFSVSCVWFPAYERREAVQPTNRTQPSRFVSGQRIQIFFPANHFLFLFLFPSFFFYSQRTLTALLSVLSTCASSYFRHNDPNYSPPTGPSCRSCRCKFYQVINAMGNWFLDVGNWISSVFCLMVQIRILLVFGCAEIQLTLY